MMQEKTTLKCMDLLLNDMEIRVKEGYTDFRDDRELYEDVKRLFEKHFRCKIRTHYEEHYFSISG